MNIPLISKKEKKIRTEKYYEIANERQLNDLYDVMNTVMISHSDTKQKITNDFPIAHLSAIDAHKVRRRMKTLAEITQFLSQPLKSDYDDTSPFTITISDKDQQIIKEIETRIIQRHMEDIFAKVIMTRSIDGKVLNAALQGPFSSKIVPSQNIGGSLLSPEQEKK